MKKLLLLLSLTFAVLNVNASVRDWEQKRLIAAEFLKVKGLNGNSSKTRTAAAELEKLKEYDNLTIVGNCSTGFVLIPNDDVWPEVIGYSDSDFSEMPPSFTWYLTAANAALATGNPDIAAYAVRSSEYKETIEPLVKTTWGQGAPYNSLCPTYTSGSASVHYPTGCVATAMSQIMNYYQHPVSGTGSKSYSFSPDGTNAYVLSVDFTQSVYDWSNLLNSYTGTNYTEEQANAVAKLMYDCGISLEMSYTASGSGAYPSQAATALKRYFNYNSNLGVCYRDYYGQQEWLDLLFGELNADRPVLYIGYDEAQGGHAFVVDGYDADKLFHVNWGWDGSADGYYDLALLNPLSYSFSKSQNMMVGFTMPDENIEHRSEVCAEAGSFTVTGRAYNGAGLIPMLSNTVYNLSDATLNGKVALILYNESFKQIYQETDIKANYGFGLFTQNPFTSFKISDIPDGTYRIYPAVKDELDSQWWPVRFPEGTTNSYIVTKSGSSKPEVTADASTEWHTEIVTTGIQNIEYTSDFQASKTGNPACYTLDGRQIDASHASNGIYILRQSDGTYKKFIVK